MLAVGARTRDHWAMNGGPRWPHRPVRTSTRRTAAAWVRPPCFMKATFERSPLGLAQEAPIAVHTSRETACVVREVAMAVHGSPGGSSPRTPRERSAGTALGRKMGGRAGKPPAVERTTAAAASFARGSASLRLQTKSRENHPRFICTPPLCIPWLRTCASRVESDYDTQNYLAISSRYDYIHT